jgi:hypothetical protein
MCKAKQSNAKQKTTHAHTKTTEALSQALIVMFAGNGQCGRLAFCVVLMVTLL